MAKIRLKKRFKEKIPGGLASGKDISSFDADSIKKGVKTELEHTSDIDVATEIAMDHLAEDPLYYDKLEKMEKGVNEMKLKIKKVLKEEVCLDEMCGDMPQNNAAPPDFSGEPDPEGEMADSQMLKVHQYSKELMDMIDDEMQLPSWVQAKLTKVADYMGAVKHYLEGEMALSEQQKPDYPDLDKDGDKEEPISKAVKDAKKKDLDEKKRKFPDLTGDGKVTKADILKGRGVIEEENIEEASIDHLVAAVAPLFLPDGAPEIPPEAVENLRMLGEPILKSILAKMKTVMAESYILEASCEDGEMYEMELYSEDCGCGALEESLEEAEYRGRKVQLNKPMRGDVKKFKVFVKDPKTGNVKKVNFGDPNMRIKKSNPKRRKSFRARHNCDNPGPKTKARYWSCRKWEE